MSSLDQFSGRKYIVVESYKKNGEPKQTPVQSIEYEGLIYIRTDPSTWKVSRIKRNPNVRIALSDRNGKIVGRWISGEARILEGENKNQILDVFKKEYGSFGYSMVGFVGRLRGEKQMTTVISVKLLPQTATL